jgi:hypothetical protein
VYFTQGTNARWFYAIDDGVQQRIVPRHAGMPLGWERDAAFELFRIAFDSEYASIEYDKVKAEAIKEFTDAIIPVRSGNRN